ncbi:MAG TPA: TIM-barrel domain-containing protein, partial [Terracidiphilus sp.]
MKRFASILCALTAFVSVASVSTAQTGTQAESRAVLSSPGETIVLEPYAPNILRVTISKDETAAKAAPGYGIVGKPDAAGWTLKQAGFEDEYRSARIVVTVHRPHPNPNAKPGPMPETANYFSGSAPWANVTVKTPEGKTVLDMVGWEQADYNHKDGTAQLANDRRPGDGPSYVVGATFRSPDDEHYYGLGQNQEGFLDHRGHPVRCWHDYNAPAAPSSCVPFSVTNKGYGLLWDNPSKTTILPGFNEVTRWSSESGNRVSYFVIAGDTADEIYAGYRLLTGPTPMLPKAAYGYIQCKQRYSSQDELLSVAKGYRDRHLPADVLV